MKNPQESSLSLTQRMRPFLSHGHYTFLAWVMVVIILAGCIKDEQSENAWKPIYNSYTDFSTVQSLPSRSFRNLGKIVTAGNLLFINERDQGIHVLDNSNPAAPKPLFFWNIPGNREFTIVDQVLYADNGKHLLVIDISNPAAISFVRYLPDVYDPQERDYFPEGRTGWFECADPKKGIVIRWEMALLNKPNCRMR